MEALPGTGRPRRRGQRAKALHSLGAGAGVLLEPGNGGRAEAHSPRLRRLRLHSRSPILLIGGIQMPRRCQQCRLRFRCQQHHMALWAGLLPRCPQQRRRHQHRRRLLHLRDSLQDNQDLTGETMPQTSPCSLTPDGKRLRRTGALRRRAQVMLPPSPRQSLQLLEVSPQTQSRSTLLPLPHQLLLLGLLVNGQILPGRKK